MIRSITRHWWFGLLGLAMFALVEDGQAWENPFVKVSNVRFNVHVEMSTLPKAPPPLAPWYAYFPSDARMLPPPQASPYPPWPMQFPPPGPPADALKYAPKQGRDSNLPGPMLTQYWPNYYNAGSNLQPVGYAPAQMPTYWYQGR